MPSHSERVRANYRCPVCDGEGRVDDYEGSYECYECDGAGIILVPKIRPAGRTLTLAEKLVVDESLRVLSQQVSLLNEINREYTDESAQVGYVINVKLPRRFGPS